MARLGLAGLCLLSVVARASLDQVVELRHKVAHKTAQFDVQKNEHDLFRSRNGETIFSFKEQVALLGERLSHVSDQNSQLLHIMNDAVELVDNPEAKSILQNGLTRFKGMIKSGFMNGFMMSQGQGVKGQVRDQSLSEKHSQKVVGWLRVATEKARRLVESITKEREQLAKKERAVQEISTKLKHTQNDLAVLEEDIKREQVSAIDDFVDKNPERCHFGTCSMFKSCEMFRDILEPQGFKGVAKPCWDSLKNLGIEMLALGGKNSAFGKRVSAVLDKVPREEELDLGDAIIGKKVVGKVPREEELDLGDAIIGKKVVGKKKKAKKGKKGTLSKEQLEMANSQLNAKKEELRRKLYTIRKSRERLMQTVESLGDLQKKLQEEKKELEKQKKKLQKAERIHNKCDISLGSSPRITALGAAMNVKKGESSEGDGFCVLPEGNMLPPKRNSHLYCAHSMVESSVPVRACKTADGGVVVIKNRRDAEVSSRDPNGKETLVLVSYMKVSACGKKDSVKGGTICTVRKLVYGCKHKARGVQRSQKCEEDESMAAAMNV